MLKLSLINLSKLALIVGEKKMTLEEFLPIYSQMKKDKDVGAFEDLMEGLKVYDKMDNGTMLCAELAHTLLSLGKYMTWGHLYILGNLIQ